MKNHLFFLALIFSTTLFAANETDWNYWKKSEANNTRKIDHKAWQLFLNQYLDTSSGDEINRIHYGKVSQAEQKNIAIYIQGLESEKVTALNRNEQMAFWINLYNAVTVSLILQNYPVKSIRDIHLSTNKFQQTVWDTQIINIENHSLTLNDIENHILRPLFGDNRVHFALNCASLGCPNLSTIAFTGQNLETQLNKGIQGFIHSERGIYWKDNSLQLSSLFDWYRSDFGKSDRELLDFLSRYSKPTLKLKLKTYSGTLQYQYDWALNDA